MASERYVVLGLARPRARWFTEVARWATAGVAPLEFVKCLSASEVASRLDSGRRFSALLVDATGTGVDRDLVDLSERHRCAVVIVGADRADWQALGACTALPADFDRAALLDALATHAELIGDTDARAGSEPTAAPVTPWRGQLVAVTGAGGVGSSTAAMALAQGLADDARHAGMVLLADLALDADLAMFHDAGDIVPGVQELVDAHRHRSLGPSELRAMSFEIGTRRYRLLLGLRQHRDWTALRPRAVDAALDSARGAFHLVVADIDDDFEGDAETGSSDIEDRNVLARTAARQADVLVVVGNPGLKGLYAMHRLIRDLVGFGVAPERVLPVVNRAPRSPRARAEFDRAFAELSGPVGIAAPIPLPERRGVDELHRDAARLPSALSQPLAAAVQVLLDRLPSVEATVGDPDPIAPGSLGTWTDQEAAS